MTKITIKGHIHIFEHHHDIIEKRLSAKIDALILKYPNAEFFVGQAEGVDQIARKVLNTLNRQHQLLDKCSETDERDITKFYEAQANEIVSFSDHIMVVWDGIFSFKKGGTSDIVRKSIFSDRSIQIHHLITPQKANPYPVHSLNEEVIDFQNGKFNRIPFSYNFGWISFKNSAHSNTKKKKRKFWKSQDANILGSYLLPVLLVFTTLLLGLIGFLNYSKTTNSGFANNVFNAAQLLTLELSDTETEEGSLPLVLNLARFVALLFLIYAFFYGLYLALGEKWTLLKLRFWQKKSNFSIVLGLNLESKYLITDLSEKLDQNVVLLYQENNEAFFGRTKVGP